MLPDLREAIERGDYRIGSQLPSNETIRAQYRVSTGTVSRAIAALKDAGMLEGPRGKRPRVIANSPIRMLTLAAANSIADDIDNVAV